jgi:hypothetical protein
VIADIVDVAWRVAVALEHVGVPYFLGGSVASSLQATARTTNDVDFVVDLAPAQVDAFVRELGPDFAVDDEALREAARLRRSWNIFHLPTGLKVDLMMRQDTPYDREAFSRRKRFRIDVDMDPFIKSVEDSILKKLQWYLAGDRVSSTQWRDVVELIRVNAPTLDRAYLERWAGELGVAADLARASGEAERPPA